MRLLVSVRDAREAIVAVANGADVIDVKEPARGALGAPTSSAVRAIRHAIADRIVSVVIGDACEPDGARAAARSAMRAGADVVKVGLAGVRHLGQARAVVAAACEGAGGRPVVVVAYADAGNAATLDAEQLLGVGIAERAAGFLVDTYAKEQGSLFALAERGWLVRLVARAHAAGLFAGLAGGLGIGDIDMARAMDADLMGVRGGACRGMRTDELCGDRVRALSDACARLARPA